MGFGVVEDAGVGVYQARRGIYDDLYRTEQLFGDPATPVFMKGASSNRPNVSGGNTGAVTAPVVGGILMLGELPICNLKSGVGLPSAIECNQIAIGVNRSRDFYLKLAFDIPPDILSTAIPLMSARRRSRGKG